MFLAGKALFLSSSADATILHKTGGTIMIKG
jgi:hypothetical protein